MNHSDCNTWNMPFFQKCLDEIIECWMEGKVLGLIIAKDNLVRLDAGSQEDQAGNDM